MNLRKAFAIGVSVTVLGLQAYLIFPPQPHKRYRTWPFLDYPMYSRSHSAGDVYRDYELRGQPCGAADTVRRLSASDIRMEDFVYWKTLAWAAGDYRRGTSEQAMRVPGDVIRGTMQRTPFCRAAVWRREYRIRDFRGLDVPWTEVRQWDLRRAAAAATSVPGSTP